MSYTVYHRSYIVVCASHTHTEVPGTGGASSPSPGTQETSAGNGEGGPVTGDEPAE